MLRKVHIVIHLGVGNIGFGQVEEVGDRLFELAEAIFIEGIVALIVTGGTGSRFLTIWLQGNNIPHRRPD